MGGFNHMIDHRDGDPRNNTPGNLRIAAQAPTRLTYEEVGHRYFLDGRQIPGITSVLADLGYNGAGAAFFTENSRSRGTAVHAICAAVDTYAPEAVHLEDALSVFSAPIAESLHPYLAGWLLFRREHRFETGTWEQRVHSGPLMVAGTIDVTGTAGSTPTILDIKTWNPAPVKPKRSAELQLAAYALMSAGFRDGPCVQRWIVCLSGDGRYRLLPCTNRVDFSIVTSIAAVWWDLHKAGLIKMHGDPEVQDEA
jgi:hypothetical protein